MKQFFGYSVHSNFSKRFCNDNFFDSINFDKNLCEKIFSLNKTNANKQLIQNAKKIIVGTLTPPEGMQNGYYYSSSKNKVFGIIDKCFDNGGVLTNLKKQLANDKKSTKILQNIENYLQKQQIAFIDVIDRAIRIKGSSKDDDILFYTLDYDVFKQCDSKQMFICTSLNAKNGLLAICKNGDVKIDTKNIFVCYQDRFHFNLQDWKEKLR